VPLGCAKLADGGRKTWMNRGVDKGRTRLLRLCNGASLVLEANCRGAQSINFPTTFSNSITGPPICFHMAPEQAAFQPKDAISAAVKATLITGGAGALISSIQNTLTKQNVGAWGVFTRTGGTIAVFGMSTAHAAHTPS
jgi:hypothetical protein